MPLLDDNLTIWKIAFRWAGFDSETLLYRVFIPPAAKDNIRLLINAISSSTLYCKSLNPDEFLKNDTPRNRQDMNYVSDCISDVKYHRAFLCSHSIYRSDFAHWCKRTGILFPEFWFPPGWVVHELHEKDMMAGKAPDMLSMNQLPVQPTSSDKTGKRGAAEENIWKPVEAVAIALWVEDNLLSIADVIRKIKAMKHLVASAFAETTIRKHIAHLSPMPGTPGRKPSKN